MRVTNWQKDIENLREIATLARISLLLRANSAFDLIPLETHGDKRRKSLRTRPDLSSLVILPENIRLANMSLKELWISADILGLKIVYDTKRCMIPTAFNLQRVASKACRFYPRRK